MSEEKGWRADVRWGVSRGLGLVGTILFASLVVALCLFVLLAAGVGVLSLVGSIPRLLDS